MTTPPELGGAIEPRAWPAELALVPNCVLLELLDIVCGNSTKPQGVVVEQVREDLSGSAEMLSRALYSEVIKYKLRKSNTTSIVH